MEALIFVCPVTKMEYYHRDSGPVPAGLPHGPSRIHGPNLGQKSELCPLILSRFQQTSQKHDLIKLSAQVNG